jgi:hypothetical protein
MRGEDRANLVDSLVAFCRVSYRDIEGIEHAVEVTAGSLYEAVALAVARFRSDDGWAMCPPGPGCEFHVKVFPDSPVTYSIPLKRVEAFALHGTVAGPQDILRKERIRELLGRIRLDRSSACSVAARRAWRLAEN